ncbi:MAG: caspase family protein [Nitrospirae bacterium]|nr:caspase family protein [Nitrospirota bacterium]
MKENSKVFIYYSGHGAPDSKGNGYIVPFDGDPNYLEVTGYPLDKLYANLESLKAAEIMVVMDSCFSGAGGRSILPKGARPISLEVQNPMLLSDKIAIISSSKMDQISTSYSEKALGLFTYYFLTALKDGKMTFADIYSYIKPMVEDEAKKMNVEQSPQLLPGLSLPSDKFSLR